MSKPAEKKSEPLFHIAMVAVVAYKSNCYNSCYARMRNCHCFPYRP